MNKKAVDLESLKARVADFPRSPGVYLMKNNQNKVIYVGKAKRLRDRVRSYLNPNIENSKTQLLVRHIEGVDYILTETEAEAFLLEASLIKKHNPRYNIRLKDDKTYPYIRLSLKDSFPRFYLARRVINDGSRYFGPYVSGSVVKNIMGFLNRSFKIRDCSDRFMKSRKRPCMTYQIGACTAPCVDFVDAKSYGRDVKRARRFLEKESSSVVKELKREMLKLAGSQKFELAAQHRDNIAAIEKVLEKQAVVSGSSTNNQDAIGFYGNKQGTLIETLHVRQGRVIGCRSQFFSQIDPHSEQEDVREWLTSFVNQYYQDNVVPDEIYLPVDMGFEIIRLLKEVFAHRGYGEVLITFPTHSEGQRLIAMANRNAKSRFHSQVSKSGKRKRALKLIAGRFKLKEPPGRIECFDISHFQGAQSVGSQVVSENGVLNTNLYRRYRLRSKTGGDDYEALAEVLTRRLKNESRAEPDLIIIDGGRGQLNVVLRVLKTLGKSHLPVVGLAKQRAQSGFRECRIEKSRERFYLPGRQNPVTFAEGSEAFKILVGLRNEAHRFALSFHRKQREARSLESQLDRIKGLGPVLIRRLLCRFGSVVHLRNASLKELSEIRGLSRRLALEIVEFFKNSA